MKRRQFLSSCAAAGTAASANVLKAQQSRPSPFPIKPEVSVEKANAMVVTRNQAKVYSQGLGEARILVDGERSGGAWWLGEFREDPGFMTALHFHYRQDEQFFVLEGVLSVYVDGKWLDLEPGTVAVIPHGMHHAQGNMGTEAGAVSGIGESGWFRTLFCGTGQGCFAGSANRSAIRG